jgi:hypothetical protein
MLSPTTGELYVKAVAATQQYLDSVRADQRNAPTPSTEWNVKQVANHIIGENLWAGELLRGKNIAEWATDSMATSPVRTPQRLTERR